MDQLWSHRQRAARWVVAALFLAGCKSSTSPGSTTPAGLFKGTFVSGSTSGVLTLTFPGKTSSVLAASVLPIPTLNLAAAAAPISITGTLAITGDGTVALSGTYDASANPQLSVAGGGYTISGNYTATSGLFTGSFTGPSASGTWNASAGGTTVKVFCGTYGSGSSSTGSGTWNLVLDNSNNVNGVANTSKGQIQLTGTYTPGTPGTISVTWSGGTASGTLNLTTGGGGGMWSATAGGSGMWAASTTGC